MEPSCILVVDDDVRFGKTLVDILRIKGYESRFAGTGREATQAITDLNPSVALIDLRLQDMSGLDLIGAIKGLSPGTECIVLTGHASQTSAIEAINLGAYSYVQKPCDIDQLLVTVRRAIEKRDAEDALQWELAVHKALASVSNVLIASLTSIHEIARVVLQHAQQITGSRHGYVSEIDVETKDMISYTLADMGRDECPIAKDARNVVFSIRPDGTYPALWGYALNNRAGFYTNEPAAHPSAEGTRPGHIPLENFLSVPALIDRVLVGQIALANADHPYSDRDLEAIARLANLYALAVQRQRAEGALQQSEREKAVILDSLSELVAYENLDHEILWANRAAAESTGKTVRELVGSQCDDIWSQESWGGCPVTETLETGQSRQATVDEPDGRVWSVRGYPVRDHGGDVIGAVRVGLDITDQVTAQQERERLMAHIQEQAQQMQRVIDTVPEGVMLLDEGGAIVVANPMAQEYLSVLDSTPLSGLLSASDDQAWHELQAGGCTFETMARSVQIAPETTGWVLVIRDMTHEREMQLRLRQQDRMAVIGQLAGGVAHDFNNILTAIQGYTEFALNDLVPGDPVRMDLEEIKRASSRAAALTNQLLIFSRQQILQPKKLTLNAAIGETEKMLRRLIGENIALRISLNPNLGWIEADPGQIEQVIMNLVINARDAMPNGGELFLETDNVTLDEAYAREHPEVMPGQYGMLAVRDTGVGMDEEVQSHLFEPFFTTKEPGKGTGLGLATVWGIVKQSGGHIVVESSAGQGTTFRVYVPRIGESAMAPEGALGVVRPDQGTETILLVEDEDMVRRLARRGLERQGYTVLEARLPSEALRVVEQHPTPIPLLVTDVIMPEMSGRELADLLSALHPDLEVLFISGYTDDAIAHQGVLEPGVAFLEKPFTPGQLAHKVRELLDGHKRKEQ